MPGSRGGASSPFGTRRRLARRLSSRRVVVADASMEPTLAAGDRLWVEPARRVARGEIVVVRDPEDSDRLLVKRVGAIAGDRVYVTRTGVRDVPEAPTQGPPEDALEEVVVPPRHLFLVSDRPALARDSRKFGPVRVELLVGRAWYRYFPPGRRGEL